MGANVTLTVDKSVSTSQALNLTGTGVLGSVVNNGSITASGAAVVDTTFGQIAPKLINNGTLATTGGVPALSMSSFGLGYVTNNGTITGPSVGVDVGSQDYFAYGVPSGLVNSGTISGGRTGVWINGYGWMLNQSTGVINGGVGPSGGSGNVLSASLWNAGQINGNVTLGSGSGFASGNQIVLLPGSVINGDLTLGGGGDLLAVSVTNNGPGQLAGVTGKVIASLNSSLHYLAASDASASIVVPTGFTSLTYELDNNANLTLTGSTKLPTISFAGAGTVDLTADLTGNGVLPILTLQSPPLFNAQAGWTPPANTNVNLTSRGTLTQVQTSSTYFIDQPSVVLATTSQFTNAGTITVQGLPSANLPMAAVVSSGAVTNSGTINLSGADAVRPNDNYFTPLTVTNSGVIRQTAGGATSRGIVYAATVANTGVISVGGPAVMIGNRGIGVRPYSLTNSGLINSDGDSAVVGTGFGATTVTNQAGGVISGKIYGVYLGPFAFSAESVVNAGTISGGTDSVLFTGFNPNTLTLQTGSTLIGPAVGVAGGSDALILQGSGEADNVFTNFKTLTAQGPGTWILGANSAISQTTIAGGTLVIDGALSSSKGATVSNGTLQVGDAQHPGAQLAANVTVATGATLSGHGTVIGDVSNSGVVAPGGSIGALTINGNFVQTASGVLSIAISPTANSTLTVTKTASLAGALSLSTASGVFRKGQVFTVLTAASISGAFASVTSSGGGQFSLTQTAGSVSAVVSKGNFAIAGGTPNQAAIAAGFADYPAGISDFDPVANAVIALPAGAPQNAGLDQLGGEIDADFLRLGREQTRGVFDALGQQLSGAAETGGRQGWGQVLGRSGVVGTDGDAHGFSRSGYGLIIGDQTDMGGGTTTVGAAVNYQHSEISLHGLGPVEIHRE